MEFIMAKARRGSKTGGQLKISLKLNPKRIEQIQRCLKKGRLTITVSRVSSIGRADNGYLYD
jgi:hypothetical protein